jgi:hypothetical protein
MLATNEIKAILKPQFGLLGKGGEFKAEPLWVHAFTLWSIASKIIKFIPRFDDKERRLLEITVLIHDIGKMTEKNQAVLAGQAEGKVRHTQNKEQITAYFEDNALIEPLGLSEADIDFIYHAHLHHALPEEALKTALPSLAVYADIVRYADWLASMERLDRRQVQQISSKLNPFCQITAVHISRPEGPSNYLLFDTAYNIYKEMGWDALIVLPDSLLLIAPKGTKYPEKKEVVSEFQKTLIKNSLSLQKPNPTDFTSALLAGESAKYPRLYLETQEEYLKDALADFDRAPSFFFKLLIEMLDNSSKLTAEIREKYPILDILKGLCGTRGVPIARKKWTDMGGVATDPLKEMLKEMCGAISLIKVIPSEILNTEESDTDLKKISSDKLFEILISVSEKLYPVITQDVFSEEIESLISMEEEIDFRNLAIKRFEKYKEYKSTQNPERGICESCGFTDAFPAQKSLNFPNAHGFSQIKAKPDALKATCLLCTYDTLVSRSNISKSRNPVYIRIEAKTADLWQLYDETAKLIQRLETSFYNPYTLETLEKSQDYGFLPLPKNFKMPQLKEPKYVSQPLTSVRGYIIPVSRVKSPESPKDLRARYLCLYALLKMMGFDTHIGFEEQNGLFGDNPIARHGDDYESLYYRGLAIKWLANLLDKSNNANVFAETLLTKSPSVALTKIGDASEDKKIKKEQAANIVETLIKGNFRFRKTKNGGEYTMRELLKDAAFFAEGIPSFMWSGEEHKAWISNSSKHLITKPVSKTMNCILQGDDFENAFAKFLSLIKEDISGDKTKEGSLAKVDVGDLKVFVEKAKEILNRYHTLRQTDISAFIQAKNALLSSIYLLKRYPNIKEVVNE